MVDAGIRLRERRAMTTWGEFTQAAPELAREGQRLLYQHGVGLAYLATVDADGGPRVHPVCPLLDRAGLYLFVIPSPKLRDLVRDGRYALHSFPCEDDESGLFLAGRARQVGDPALRAALSEQFVAERSRFDVAAPEPDQLLFELGVDRCLLTASTGHDDPAPRKQVWRAAPVAGSEVT
jgi:hypothetical protein